MSDFLSNNSSNLAIFTMFYGSSLDMLAHEECVPNLRSGTTITQRDRYPSKYRYRTTCARHVDYIIVVNIRLEMQPMAVSRIDPRKTETGLEWVSY